MNNAVRRRWPRVCKRCAFTGYRPQKLPFGFNESDPACVALKKALYQEIESLIGQGYAHFLSGGAIATDTWAAEAVLELKAKYPWIMLEMVSPLTVRPTAGAKHTGHATIGCLTRPTS